MINKSFFKFNNKPYEIVFEYIDWYIEASMVYENRKKSGLLGEFTTCLYSYVNYIPYINFDSRLPINNLFYNNTNCTFNNLLEIRDKDYLNSFFTYLLKNLFSLYVSEDLQDLFINKEYNLETTIEKFNILEVVDLIKEHAKKDSYLRKRLNIIDIGLYSEINLQSLFILFYLVTYIYIDSQPLIYNFLYVCIKYKDRIKDAYFNKYYLKPLTERLNIRNKLKNDIKQFLENLSNDAINDILNSIRNLNIRDIFTNDYDIEKNKELMSKPIVLFKDYLTEKDNKSLETINIFI